MDESFQEAMYGDNQEQNNDVLLKHSNNISVTSNVKLLNSKSFIVELAGEKIEVVKKSYVEKIESDLANTKKSVRILQSKFNKIIGVINSFTRELDKLRNEISNRNRFN